MAIQCYSARNALIEYVQPMSGISHVSVGVNDLARARAFYDPLMRVLGLRIRQADDESIDFGTDDALSYSLETPVDGRPGGPG